MSLPEQGHDDRRAQMEHWFIYYKCPAGEATQALAAARELQARLATQEGVVGRVLRRPQDDSGMTTLMEVYEPVADPARFARAMDAALAASALTSGLRSARRLERFIDA